MRHQQITKTVERHQLSATSIQLLVFVFSLLSWACVPDFERFKNVEFESLTDSGSVSADTNVGDQDTTSSNLQQDAGADVEIPDADPDTSAPEDTGGTSDTGLDAGDSETSDSTGETSDDTTGDDTSVAPIGAPCGDEADCSAGQSCLEALDEGFCTTACDGDVDCPQGDRCVSISGDGWCLSACNDDEDCERGGYGCVTSEVSAVAACLSDDDRDGALNSTDNCPSEGNRSQQDSDRDGRGDLCDDTPNCPGDQTVSMEPPPTAAINGALVEVPPLDAVFYLGGEEAGEPSRQVSQFDLTEARWEVTRIPALPYPLSDAAAAFDQYRGRILVAGGDGINRIFSLKVALATGEAIEGESWRQGPALPVPLWGTEMALMNPDKLLVTGYTGSTTEMRSVNWQAFLVDLNTDNVRQVGGNAPSFTTAGDIIIEPMSDGLFYLFNSRQRDRFFTIDPEMVEWVGETLLQFELFFESAPIRDNYPIVSLGGSWPFLYFARLDQGDVQKVELSAGIAQGSPYSLALPDVSDIDGTSYKALRLSSSRSLMTLFSESESAPEMLEHFVLCSENLETYDTDNDGVTNYLDNCPNVRNISQTDIDQDGLGDSCDSDLDGDGRENSEDRLDGDAPQDLQYDSDNDGLTNQEDRDDDDDGIEDSEDRHPLDSDNDGIPNIYDEDDDGDGISDLDEIAGGSSSTNPLSQPGGERVAFITGEGEARELIMTTVSRLGRGERPAGHDTVGAIPSWPRLSRSGQWLVYSDINTPAEPVVVVQALEGDDTAPKRVEGISGVHAAGVDFAANDPPELAVISEAPEETGRWTLSLLPKETWSSVENIWEPAMTLEGPPSGLDIADDQSLGLTYSSGLVGCMICADVFTAQMLGSSSTRVTAGETGLNDVHPRLSDNGRELLFINEDINGRGHVTLWVEDEVSVVTLNREGWDIDSADFAPNSRRLLVVARPSGEALGQLYVVEMTTGAWYQLTSHQQFVGGVSEVSVSN